MNPRATPQRFDPLSPAALARLKGIERAAHGAPDDELAVAGFDYGRDALAAAASAAHRAASIHMRGLREASRADQLRQALEQAARHSDLIVALANVSPAAAPARELATVARAQLAEMAKPSRRGRGSPGRPVQTAAARAAAEVWAASTGRSIPTGGIKNPEHPLAQLFDAISLDLFGQKGRLSAEYLRAGRKSSGPL